ncbi:MAG: fused MFS/spermidine synthase, partial [Azospirillaceae bacterium]
ARAANPRPTPPPAPSAGGGRVRPVVLAAVFVTGAVTLALEVVASRALTPYVGGSLFVWTAILSVTLLALAGGYHLGSRWSARFDPRRLFVRLPAVTALVLCAVAVLYPIVLPGIAYADALAGAFVGSALVLGPVLVLTSAMGPLGIALFHTSGGDGGAGEVFAVSTVGSVIGALVASFTLLPYMPPAATMVLLAGVLAAVSAGALVLGRDRLTLAGLLPVAAVALAGAGASLAAPPQTVDLGLYEARHVATERGAHGTVVVVDVAREGYPGTVRLYLEENQMQSARSIDGQGDRPGEPLFYVAVAEAVLQAHLPDAARVLMLGLAGGTLATDLAAAGHGVTAVDINPRAPEVAEKWFGFDPAAVTVRIEDGRRHLAHCGAGPGEHRPYDAIVFDTFSGLSVPDHLVTAEAFAAARSCLVPGGLLVANTIVPPLDARPTRRLMAAIATGMEADLAVYQSDDARRRNRIMVARKDGPPPGAIDLEAYPSSLFVRRARRLDPAIVTRDALADTAPLTDRRNDFALATARMARDLSHFPIPASWY